MEENDKYSNYEQIFKKGSIVEVSSEDEGLRGSWYTATVLQTFSRKTLKILVQYHNLMSDVSCSKPLREYVPAVLVRPIPPREPHIRFSAMDDVDAFHNDGWWEGVVTNISWSERQQPPSFLYSVFFRCSREQIDFCPSDLRLHREWVPNGNFWVPPLGNPSHASPGQRNGRNSYQSSDDKNRVVTRDGRRSSLRSVNNHMVGTIRKDENLRISSNGTCKNNGVTSNGKLKRRRASK